MKEILPSLFMDLINSGMAQSDHTQSNSKKGHKNRKDQIPPNQFFCRCRKTTNEISMNLLVPFILQNFLKNLRADSELWGCAPCSEPKWSICPEQKFFGANHCYFFFIYILALFIVQNLKKFLQWIQNYDDAPFLGPKWPISPNENLFRKPVHGPCFFYSGLSTCQKSKSDINLLVESWWLKNTEISMAKSHFCLSLEN